MARLAKDFGLSDVGLSKICDRHRVPTPPRGYWAKKEAGKKVKQAIFAAVDDPLLDRIRISPQHDKLPEPVRIVVERRRAERKALARPSWKATMAAPVNSPIEDPHPSIRATATALRRAKPSQTGVIEAIGPGLCGISIGQESVERIIFILHHLAITCEGRGVKLSPADTQLRSALGQDGVTFVIKEKSKQVPHVLTERERIEQEKQQRRNERLAHGRRDWDAYGIFAPSPPKFDTVRTGDLALEVHEWGDGLRRAWRDGKTQVLETMLIEIVDGLEAHIAAVRHRREQQELTEAARREFERRRALAKARRERKSGRQSLLNKLICTERHATQLRAWILSQSRYLAMSSRPRSEPHG